MVGSEIIESFTTVESWDMRKFLPLIFVGMMVWLYGFVAALKRFLSYYSLFFLGDKEPVCSLSNFTESEANYFPIASDNLTLFSGLCRPKRFNFCSWPFDESSKVILGN